MKISVLIFALTLALVTLHAGLTPVWKIDAAMLEEGIAIQMMATGNNQILSSVDGKLIINLTQQSITNDGVDYPVIFHPDQNGWKVISLSHINAETILYDLLITDRRDNSEELEGERCYLLLAFERPKGDGITNGSFLGFKIIPNQKRFGKIFSKPRISRL